MSLAFIILQSALKRITVERLSKNLSRLQVPVQILYRIFPMKLPLIQTTPGTSTNFVSDFTDEISDEVPVIRSTTGTSTNSILDISNRISGEVPLIRTTSFIPSSDLAKAVLQSDTPSESTTADKNTGTGTQFSKTTKQPNLPVPKEFPIDLCQVDYYGKELIQTGILTERGKRQVLSEIVPVMNMLERYCLNLRL